MEITHTKPEGLLETENHIKLLIISKWCALVPLAVGWSIFLLWAFVKLVFDHSIIELMDAGEAWIPISVVICSSGIILNAIFIIINRKQFKLNFLAPFGLTLINIPSVFFIIFSAIQIH